jgi:hypothetical protein
MLEPQKTRRELKSEGFSVLRYAELLIRGKIPPLRRRRSAADVQSVLGAAATPGYIAAANNLMQSNNERNVEYQQQAAIGATRQDAAARRATAMDFMAKATAANTVDITNDFDSSSEQHQHQQGRAASGSFTQSNTMQSNQNDRMKPNVRKKTINDIVVPAMKNGNLPYGGYWKFFPLPEVQDSIDLGPLKGWKLKLEPISFAAKPIILDVCL